MEWKNPQLNGDDHQEEDQDSGRQKEKAPVLFRPNTFIAFEDHPSLVEVIELQRAKRKGNNAVTLDRCFETFTKAERLDENNMWYCSTCKEHVRAMKTMKLWRLPNILVVHLKRFEFKHSLRRDKLDTPVEFPLEGLDMSKHCSVYNTNHAEGQENIVNSNVDATYDLFAVVNHFGRMGFGHYTAYCRQWDEDGLSPQWYLYDDSNVRPVDRAEVSGPAAYVLFYRRRQFH
jgi:ubiquitin carboxyl-terminal hydrolase 4/11/15